MEPKVENELSLNQLKKERDRLFQTYETAGPSLPDQGRKVMNKMRTLEDLIQDKEKRRTKRPNLLDEIIAKKATNDPMDCDVKASNASLEVDKTPPNKQRKTRVQHPTQESEEELFFSTIIRKSVEKRRLNQEQASESVSNEKEEPRRRSERIRSKISKVEVVDLSTEAGSSHDCFSLNFNQDGSSCSHQSSDSLISNVVALYPPGGGKGHVQILGSDLERLKPDECLNDICVNFYLKYIEEQSPYKERCYIFRSYFYTKLMETPSNIGSNCSTWTKEVNIFDFDYIFIPVCAEFHWSLSIVCFATLVDSSDSWFKRMTKSELCTPCILHFDSLEPFVGHNTEEIADVIRRYLKGEWNRKRPNSEIKNFNWRTLPAKRLDGILMQENSADCGLFLLVFLENFCFQAPEQLNYKALELLDSTESWFKGFDRPFFLTPNWLDVKNVGLLRSKMLNLMHRLFLKQIPADHPAATLFETEINKYDSNRKPKYKTPNVVFQENLEKWRKESSKADR